MRLPSHNTPENLRYLRNAISLAADDFDDSELKQKVYLRRQMDKCGRLMDRVITTYAKEYNDASSPETTPETTPETVLKEEE